MFLTTMSTNANIVTVIIVIFFARILSSRFFSIALAPKKVTAVESRRATSAVTDIYPQKPRLNMQRTALRYLAGTSMNSSHSTAKNKTKKNEINNVAVCLSG